MNNALLRDVKKCDMPCVIEPSNLLPQSTLRPDGASLIPWMRGKQLVWDVTCTHTLGQSNLIRTHGETAMAAKIAEEKKLVKYDSFTNLFLFCPVAFELW